MVPFWVKCAMVGIAVGAILAFLKGAGERACGGDTCDRKCAGGCKHDR